MLTLQGVHYSGRTRVWDTLCLSIDLNLWQDPYAKRFMKDEKITKTAYIANSGGLLGLCMGFSLGMYIICYKHKYYIVQNLDLHCLLSIELTLFCYHIVWVRGDSKKALVFCHLLLCFNSVQKHSSWAKKKLFNLCFPTCLGFINYNLI